MDITRLIYQHVTPDVAARAGAAAGLPPETAETLLAAAVPGALTALLAAVRDEHRPVRAQVERAPETLARATGLLEAAPDDALGRGAAAGEAALGAPAMEGLAGRLAAHAGVGAHAARRIADLAALLALTGIREAASAQNLDAGEGLEMLDAQRGSIALAMPADFARTNGDGTLEAGLERHAGMARAAAHPAAGATERPGTSVEPAQPGRAWWRWTTLVGGIVLAAIIVLAFSRGGP